MNLSDISYTTYIGGQLKSNELGLHDMAGNVSEICSDWYGDYALSDQENPVGPAVGESHVKRGGDISVYWILCNSFITLIPGVTWPKVLPPHKIIVFILPPYAY